MHLPLRPKYEILVFVHSPCTVAFAVLFTAHLNAHLCGTGAAWNPDIQNARRKECWWYIMIFIWCLWVRRSHEVVVQQGGITSRHCYHTHIPILFFPHFFACLSILDLLFLKKQQYFWMLPATSLLSCKVIQKRAFIFHLFWERPSCVVWRWVFFCSLDTRNFWRDLRFVTRLCKHCTQPWAACHVFSSHENPLSAELLCIVLQCYLCCFQQSMASP